MDTPTGVPVPVVPIDAPEDVKALRDAMAKQAARIGELHTELDVARSQVEALNKRIGELEAAEIKANEEFTNARAALVKEKAELDTELKAKKAELDTELRAAKAEVASQHVRICEMLESGDGKHLVMEVAALKKELEAEKAAKLASQAKADTERARADKAERRANDAEARTQILPDDQPRRWWQRKK